MLEDRVTPANHVWSGAVDGNWSNAANWDSPPVIGETGPIVLNFGTTSGNNVVAMTDDIPGLSVDQRLHAPGYSVAGGAGGVTMNLTALLLPAISDTVGGTTFSATNLTINLSSATAQISVGAGTDTIAAPISDVGVGLASVGAGTLILSGNNSYTGNTLVSAGTLAAGSPTAPAPAPTR